MAGKKEEEVAGKAGGKKTRAAGLAPFASLEDLSDESPPDEKHRLTLPGIREDPSPSGNPGGQRPSITPRIDISRASSSSHHDDSSPERELFSDPTKRSDSLNTERTGAKNFNPLPKGGGPAGGGFLRLPLDSALQDLPKPAKVSFPNLPRVDLSSVGRKGSPHEMTPFKVPKVGHLPEMRVHDSINNLIRRPIPLILTSSGGTDGSGGGGASAKIGLGFTEEMAQELRKSTEELDFQDPEEEAKNRKKKLHHQQAVTKYELEAQSEKEARERKDSTASEGGLLLIGGRTSRLSSIGSVASGGSVASHISAGSAVSGHSHLSAVSGHSHLSGHSHVSGQSHLSAASNYSRASRCSSPHRMLLETSFCGPKPIPTLSLEAEYPPSESVEAALLARKTDITGAVLPPEESLKPAKPFNKPATVAKTKSNTLEVKTNKASRSHSERIAKTSGPAVVAARSSSARSHQRPHVRKKKDDDPNALVRIIPLHGSLDDSDDTLAPEEPEESGQSDQSSSANFNPEYGIFIPLKGPVDDPAIRELALGTSQALGTSHTSAKQKVTKTVSQPAASKKPEVEESDMVRFISLHGDNDEEIRRERELKTELQRPSSRTSQNVQFRNRDDDRQCVPVKKPRTPEPKSKCKPATLDVSPKSRPALSMTNLPRDESRTPSPSSLARTLLFRRSSDSSGSSRKSANTSGSSDSKTKKDSKNKSMFTSLFKKSSKDTTPTKTHEKPIIDPKITNVDFKFRQHEKEPESIIIPLHSPDSVIKPCVFTEPDEITADTGETEKKPAGHSPRETRQEDEDLLQSMKKVLENKNIIVVDVINSDTAVCYEAIIETPRTSRSKDRKRGDKSPKDLSPRRSDRPSETVGFIELEHLDAEPRVRKSSHSSCKDEGQTVQAPIQVPKVDEQSLERYVIEELERKFREKESSMAAKSPEIVQAQIIREDVRPPSRRCSRDASEERPLIRSSRELEGDVSKRSSRELEEASKRSSREIDDALKRYSQDACEDASKISSREMCNDALKRSSRENSDDALKRSSREMDLADSKRSSREMDLTDSKRSSRDNDPADSKRSSKASEEGKSPLIEETSLKKELSAGSKISSQPSREETEEKRSSESEVDLQSASGEVKHSVVDEADEERKGLFHATESVEEELPYVPTTLPQERSVAVPIIPVAQRVTEVRTCPLDRPRSATPIQPSNLDEYAASHDPVTSKVPKTEKMQITLPRTDSTGRRNSTGRPKPWTQFAEEALGSPKETRKGGRETTSDGEVTTGPPPPPLPPRGAPPPPPQWVMFDDQPERRRAPKRITTLPLRPSSTTPPVVYSYVNPEECSCECHESQTKTNPSAQCSKNDSECSYKKGSRTDKRYRT